MGGMRVVLAEDSALLRQGLAALLAEHDAVAEVVEAGDLDELLAAVEDHRPDVVLADIRMPPTHTDEGIRAAERFRATHPGLGVVVLSQHADAEGALALVAGGSTGRAYLLKERVSDVEQLVAALAAVRRGESVIDPHVVDVLMRHRMRFEEGPVARLTGREREVLGLIATGASNSAIAARLHVTSRAVEKHINSIFTKLDLPTGDALHRRVKAVLLYLADGRAAGPPRPTRRGAEPVAGLRVLEVLQAPHLDRTTTQRVRSYLVVNLVAIWGSAAGLALLDRAVGPSRSLRTVVIALALAGTVYGAAVLIAGRGRLREAAFLAVGATWVVAFSLAWSTPFTTPVGLLVLHVPSLILTDAFRLRTRTVLLGTTVLLTGVLVTLGEARRAAWDADHPDLPVPGVLVGVFTVIVATVLVLGIRDSVLRLARGRRELTESRARLAVAALEARREIERDLHDGAQQRLATLAVDIGRLGRALDTDPARARAIAHGLQDQLDTAIRELRDLAHGIYPTLLAERGLAGALPAAARRTSIACVVDVDEPHPAAPPGRRGRRLLLLPRGDAERRPALRRLAHLGPGGRRRPRHRAVVPGVRRRRRVRHRGAP